MGKRITAKNFFSRIRNKSKYRLINGLFIVKNRGGGIWEFVGEFNKKGSLGATKETAFVETFGGKRKQLFNPSKKLATTSLGFWRKLNIGFRAKPISNILK